MKKHFILILLILSLSSYTFAKTLTGGISYSVDTARTIAFQDIQYQIDMKPYQQHFFDKNKDKNLKALAKNKTSFLDRWITHYSTTNYSIQYKKDPNIIFYYDKNGKLLLIGFTQGKNFPKKSIRYDANGNLDSLCLTISSKEDFMFDKNKNLSSHWIGNNCYNTNGELIMTRQY